MLCALFPQRGPYPVSDLDLDLGAGDNPRGPSWFDSRLQRSPFQLVSSSTHLNHVPDALTASSAEPRAPQIPPRLQGLQDAEDQVRPAETVVPAVHRSKIHLRVP
jgi:hypothetical protein